MQLPFLAQHFIFQPHRQAIEAVLTYLELTSDSQVISHPLINYGKLTSIEYGFRMQV